MQCRRFGGTFHRKEMTMQINRQALRSIILDEARMNRIKTALDPKHILNDQKSYIVGGK